MARFPVFPILGAAVALAGTDKLLAIRGYRRMFRHWGWSRSAMRLVGGSEVAGGMLLVSRQTRALGGIVLSAASAAVLAAELRRAEPKLALPRLLVLGAAMAAMCPAARRA